MGNSLTKQRKFWDYVIDKNGPLQYIYTGKELHKGKYHIEHFVPYSFVKPQFDTPCLKKRLLYWQKLSRMV